MLLRPRLRSTRQFLVAAWEDDFTGYVVDCGTRIAYDSGFRSLRHLGEVFRRELDCSPGVWRKKRRS